MNKRRINRISEEIRKVISELLSREIKDPRISPMTSVTKVEVTNDLSYAYIYISVLGNEEEKENTIKGLQNAKGFIRREIGNRIDLRVLPEPVFYLDESIEQSLYISKLIDKVNKEDREKRGDDNE
ncbi:MAG: 30S ribosome-binding factor RbfA [Tissierellia bacterium]|nr:30S ribosome-binding factor RbfA [Tissierellia bacterium]